MKRGLNTDKLLVFREGKEVVISKEKFLEEKKVEGIIRIHKDEFKYYEQNEEILHFNLQYSNHKPQNTYLIMKILRRGSFDGKTEELPLLEESSAIKFDCIYAKERVPYDKVELENTPFTSFEQLKKTMIKRYSKSMPMLKPEEIIDMKIAMTLLQKKVKKATRQGFGQGLLELDDKNVYVVTADLGGSTNVDAFKKKYPERFVQVGVAEQNLVTVGSGLAHVGKIPFVTSFAAFSPGRNWEQIRTTICYNDRPVKICSTHSGLGVGEDGATHQMLEDLALMRALPNMIVIQPADYFEAKKAVKQVAKVNSPVYLRLNRQKVESIPQKSFEIGKANILKEGSDITLIAIGPMVGEALKAAQLSQKSVEVINCHTIKPLDEKTILKSIEKTGKVITIEDHQITGGLGGAIAELLAQKNPKKMVIMGVKDKFGESGSHQELYEKHGLTYKEILKQIKKLV